jgi:predicted  nucleic acid-binding Zn-ribbon protein
MKQNLLRTPLRNSAILIGIVSLVIYFTLTSPGGTVWSSFGAIICLALSTLQWLIGLSLGILICIVVLIGIFLGAAAMSDSAGASRMYESLRGTIISWSVPLAGLFKSDHEEKLQAGLDEFSGQLKTDYNKLVAAAKRELTVVHGELAGKVQTLHGKLRTVEETADGKVSKEQLEEVAAGITTLNETLSVNDAAVKALQGKVDEAVKLAGNVEVDTEKVLGDVPARIEALEQQEVPAPVDVKPLEKTIAGLQAEVGSLKTALEETRNDLKAAVAESVKPAEVVEVVEVVEEKKTKVEKKAKVEQKEKVDEVGSEPEHRLLSYFEDKADQDKLASLVAETVKKDMTYAQVMDFLIKNMSKQGNVISEHPSLAKDYIRQCRRNA